MVGDNFCMLTFKINSKEKRETCYTSNSVLLLDVIYKERESVLYHGIKTPRSVLKNEAVGRVFQQLRGVLRPW